MSIDVSVVLPVRDGACTLMRQLEALAASRTERRWELIVSDNGSTDGTRAVVEAWRGRLPRLTVVDSSARRGVSYARNVGVLASRGRYVLHCDDDDAVAPGWIEHLSTGLDIADIVGGPLEYDSLNPWRFRGCLSEDAWHWPEQQGGIWFVSGANLAYRRQVFDRIGGFDAEEFNGAAQDLEFCVRAQVQGFRFRSVPEAVVARMERRSLLAVARQHFRYGCGYRQLQRRYAGVLMEHRSSPAARRWNALRLVARCHRSACRRELVRRTAFLLGAAYASKYQMPPSPGPLPVRQPSQVDRGRLVTLGVTAFNAVDTIERAVRSAAAQTWEELEIVVVDDASTDGTAQVLARLEAELPVVRVVRHERNLGVAAARNTVLAEAQGAFLAFFDDDDVSHSDRIAWQVARLQQHEQRFGTTRPVLCHTARIIVGPDAARSNVGAAGTDPLRPAVGGQRLVQHLLQGRPLPDGSVGGGATCTQLGRVSTYRELGGFDPVFRRADDTELHVRLGAAGGGHIGVAAPLVEQHITAGPDKGVAADGAAELALLAKHRDLLPDVTAYAAGRRWIRARIALHQGRRGEAVRHLAVAWTVQPIGVPRRLAWVARRSLVRRSEAVRGHG